MRARVRLCAGARAWMCVYLQKIRRSIHSRDCEHVALEHVERDISTGTSGRAPHGDADSRKAYVQRSQIRHLHELGRKRSTQMVLGNQPATLHSSKRREHYEPSTGDAYSWMIAGIDERKVGNLPVSRFCPKFLRANELRTPWTEIGQSTS